LTFSANPTIDDFVCVDLITGKEIWRTELPEKKQEK